MNSILFWFSVWLELQLLNVRNSKLWSVGKIQIMVCFCVTHELKLFHAFKVVEGRKWKKRSREKGKENTNYYKEILLIFLSWSFILKADGFLTNSIIFLLISLRFHAVGQCIHKWQFYLFHLNSYTSYPFPCLIASACITMFTKKIVLIVWVEFLCSKSQWKWV